MQCPKCSGNMQVVTVDDIDVDRCTRCEGIWFDLREHDHLKEKHAAMEIDTGDPEQGERYDEQRDIICPRCDVKIIKLKFPGQDINYEQCGQCGGVFLDAGEFTEWAGLPIGERLARLLVPFR